MKKLCRLLLLPLFALASCADSDSSNNGNEGSSPVKPVPQTAYQVGEVLPHDTSYFTQGLEFYQNTLIEGTGMPGKSKLVRKEFPGGKILSEISLDQRYFGEGITVLNDTVYQLTWQEHVVFMYDVKTFKKLGELQINTEGWGITNDGKNLIVSDGSSNLYFYQPGTFRLLKVQAITENSSPAVNLNELEFIDGFVYANQWQYNYILKIDPATGNVVSKMDLTDVVNRIRAKDPKAEFLNGIAYNRETKKLYITGKYWPELFEIRMQ